MNRKTRYHNPFTARHQAIRASDLVAALRLAVGAADDSGQAIVSTQLLRLIGPARRYADALDRALDRQAAA